MVKGWIIYAIALIATAYYNRIEPGSISSILFYSVLMIPVMSFIHVLLTYYMFKVSHTISQRQVSKGDAITYRIKLVNNSGLLFAPMSIHFGGTHALFQEVRGEEGIFHIVAPRSEVVIEKSMQCHYRGNYPLGVDKVIIKDYFGFFRLTYRDIEQFTILVYPKLRELESQIMRSVANESDESVMAVANENQSIFSGVRDYIPGDPLNRIHYKLSAKKGDWLTKEYQGQVTHKTRIFLDTFMYHLNDEQRVVYEDYMVEACVSVVHHLLLNHVDTHLYYHRFEPCHVFGRSDSDFPDFFDRLARLSFEHEHRLLKQIQRVLELEKDTSHLMIFTQEINPALVEMLTRIQYQDYEISVVVADYRQLEIPELETLVEASSRLKLSALRIPIYHVIHDEVTTRLEVS